MIKLLSSSTLTSDSHCPQASSHTMNGPLTRYQRLEKLVLALFIISKKVKHYIQTFPITVLTEHPLRSIMGKPESDGKDIKMGLGVQILWAQIRSKDSVQRPRTGRLHR